MFAKRQDKRRLSFFLVDFKKFNKKPKENEQIKQKHNNMLFDITHKNLSRHNATPNTYHAQIITLILKPKTTLHQQYEEMLLEIDPNDFIKENYVGDTIYKKLIISIVIITNILKLYPSYISFPLSIYKVMNENMIGKQKIIDYYFNMDENSRTLINHNISTSHLDLKYLFDSSSIYKDDDCLNELDYYNHKKNEKDSVDEVEEFINELEMIEEGKQTVPSNKEEIEARRRVSKVNKRKGMLLQRMMSIFTLGDNAKLFEQFQKINQSIHGTKTNKITREQLIEHLKTKKVFNRHKNLSSEMPIVEQKLNSQSRHSVSYQKRKFSISSKANNSPKMRRSTFINFGEFVVPKFPKTAKFLINHQKKQEITSIIKSKDFYINCLKSPAKHKIYLNSTEKTFHKKSLSNGFSNANTKQGESLSPSRSSLYNKSRSRSRLICLSDSKSFGSKTSFQFLSEENITTSYNRLMTQVQTNENVKKRNVNCFRMKINNKKHFLTEKKNKTTVKFANLLGNNNTFKYKLKCM